MGYERNLQPDIGTYLADRQGLKLTGPSNAKWKTTRCEFHDGSDSMRVNVHSGAWVCMSCGAKGGDAISYEMQITGAEFIDACKALGCWIDDGKPSTQHKPTPMSARQAMSVLSFEFHLAAIAVCNFSNGVVLSEDDKDRVVVSANRIMNLMEAFQ